MLKNWISALEDKIFSREDIVIEEIFHYINRCKNQINDKNEKNMRLIQPFSLNQNPFYRLWSLHYPPVWE